ncbi:major facilitator superfamily transporter [Lentilactobacillus buchneri subsp. silagei]|uniref:permease n=1 Tax=Lentilactobacillus buchneri TaxID=1581 RepID=UPI0012E4AE00|nr:permease [Lentilactobacillus buchneri]GED93920.1 major facilitator superfamily transporter [Lentilactobacillus buchneri subsp. silagei]
MHSYFRSKGYRALMNAAIFNGIGNSLFNIVFIIYAGSLSFKTAAVSIASFITYIPEMINVVLGYYADNTHHKYEWMVLARVNQFTLFIGLALMIGLPGSTLVFGGVLAINVISDCLGTFSGSLELPYFRFLIPNEEMNDAMGFEMATETTLQMVFQGVGAVAIVWLNHNYGLFGAINAATFLIAAIVIWTRRSIFKGIDPKLSVNQPKSATPKQSLLKSLIVTGHFMMSKKVVVVILAFAFVMNTIASGMTGLINVSLLHNQALWLGNYGNIVALVSISMSLGMILGAVIQHDFLANTTVVRLAAYISWMLVFLAATFLTGISIVLIAVVSVITGYLLGKINPRVSAMFIKLIPDDRLGASMGFINMVLLIGAPIGSGFFLTIANLGSQGVFASWLIFGICSFGLAVAAMVCDRKMGRDFVEA